MIVLSHETVVGSAAEVQCVHSEFTIAAGKSRSAVI